jgi:hypothetical protein
MSFNPIQDLRDRRFRALVEEFADDIRSVERNIRLGLLADVLYPGEPSNDDSPMGNRTDRVRVRVTDPRSGWPTYPTAYRLVGSADDAEFFVKEWARRAERLRAGSEASHEG